MSRILAGGIFSQAVTPPPEDPEDPVDPPPDEPDDLGFNSGLRRLHVSASGANPIDGTTGTIKFTTIQGALNAAQPGDVITVATGVYRERLLRSNLAGTVQNPIWLVAEQRGQARIHDTFAAAETGQANLWVSEGNGVFSTARNNRPYYGYHDAAGGFDFLFPYLSEADLVAPTITRPSNAAGGNNVTAVKPPYGMAFAGGRLFVRLRNNQNPNGQRLIFNEVFARFMMDFNNVDNFILDGFTIEGGGDGRSIDFDINCSNITVRNCVLRMVRHGMSVPSNSIVENVHYEMPGYDRWCRDLAQLTGTNTNPCFMLCKSYYNAAAVGVGGGAGNALLEGSMEFGASYSTPQTNVVFDKCVFGPAFDGSRLGEYNNSTIKNSRFYACRDDGVSIETFNGFPASGDRVHDCRFDECFVDTSHQESTINGDAFIFRCLFVNVDPLMAIAGRYSIKTIDSPPACDAFYYHNTWVVDYGVDKGAQILYYDFSNGTADEIERFYNNIVIFPRGMSNGAGPNPKIIERNAVVGAGTSHLVGTGGVQVASRAAMLLDSQFVPASNSPAAGIGRTLVSGHPDSRPAGGVNNSTAGAFPVGEIPGPNWPRPLAITFNFNKPARWTSPGD